MFQPTAGCFRDDLCSLLFMSPYFSTIFQIFSFKPCDMSLSSFKCKWLNGINLRLWGIFYHQLHPTLEISYLIWIWQFPLHILTPGCFCFLKSGLNLRDICACRPGCTWQITYNYFFFQVMYYVEWVMWKLSTGYQLYVAVGVQLHFSSYFQSWKGWELFDIMLFATVSDIPEGSVLKEQLYLVF